MTQNLDQTCIPMVSTKFSKIIEKFQKSWAFWKALEMGYLIVLKRKKSEKKCITTHGALTMGKMGFFSHDFPCFGSNIS